MRTCVTLYEVNKHGNTAGYLLETTLCRTGLDIQKVNTIIKENEWDFNCWGFTAYVKGMVKKLFWLDPHYEMIDLLIEHCIQVKRPANGDIVAYWETRKYERLLHTAIVTNAKEKLIIHKPGTMELEIAQYHRMPRMYRYGNIKTYHRMKGDET